MKKERSFLVETGPLFFAHWPGCSMIQPLFDLFFTPYQAESFGSGCAGQALMIPIEEP